MTSDKKAAQSLKQIVYEDLKHQIITCEILPGAQEGHIRQHRLPGQRQRAV